MISRVHTAYSDDALVQRVTLYAVWLRVKSFQSSNGLLLNYKSCWHCTSCCCSFRYNKLVFPTAGTAQLKVVIDDFPKWLLMINKRKSLFFSSTTSPKKFPSSSACAYLTSSSKRQHSRASHWRPVSTQPFLIIDYPWPSTMSCLSTPIELVKKVYTLLKTQVKLHLKEKDKTVVESVAEMVQPPLSLQNLNSVSKPS